MPEFGSGAEADMNLIFWKYKFSERGKENAKVLP